MPTGWLTHRPYSTTSVPSLSPDLVLPDYGPWYIPPRNRLEGIDVSNLIVIGFKDKFKAEEVRLALAKLQVEQLIALDDAVVVTKDEQGKVKLNQSINLAAAGAASGGFWGLLIGLLFLNPVLGFVAGSAGGAVSGALSDLGIDDNFMRELGQTFEPGSSALFLLVRQATPDKVLERLQPHLADAKILQTSLSKDDEASLQAAFDKAKAGA